MAGADQAKYDPDNFFCVRQHMITVTPASGFTGTVVLTATITASPAGAQNLPTFSFGSTSPVFISGAAAGSATLTISTTSAIRASLFDPKRPEGAPWQILQLIGVGGMGEVWLAKQKEPVPGRVAIKLSKAGIDTPEVGGSTLRVGAAPSQQCSCYPRVARLNMQTSLCVISLQREYRHT